MKRNDLLKGFNDYFILSILSEQDSYGYEISKLINQYTDGLYTIKEATLYTAMQRLEKNNWIKSYSGTQTFGKKRTYYQMTELGRSYLNELKQEIESVISMIRIFNQKGEFE